MGSWQKTLDHYHSKLLSPKVSIAPSVVFSRDFAYADNGPIVVLESSPMAPDIHATSAKNFAELLAGQTVDIYVGREKRHWSLHKNLLCHHSSYFETELKGHEVPKKQEVSGNDTIELPDNDPRGFELLVKWLYQGHLEDCADLSDDDAKYEYAVACHKLYLLCDKFSMIRLKNLAMDQYRRCLNESQLVPDADEINEIYRASPRGTPFRDLMIKIAARQIMDPEVNREAEAYRNCFESNSDFAVEMVNAIRHMSDGLLFDDPTSGDGCEYHDHNDVADCSVAESGRRRSQVNGEGPQIVVSAHQRFPLHLVELSSDKRTPRKLNTQHSTSSASNRKPLKSLSNVNAMSRLSPATKEAMKPRREPVTIRTPTKANARAQMSPKSLPHRPAIENYTAPRNSKTRSVSARVGNPTLHVRTTTSSDVLRNPSEPSPTMARDRLLREPSNLDDDVAPAQTKPATDGKTSDHVASTQPRHQQSTKESNESSNGALERSPGTDKPNTSRRRVSRKPESSINDNDTRSTTSTTVSNSTSRSRKRKIDDRTPRRTAPPAKAKDVPTRHAPSSNRPRPQLPPRSSASSKTNGITGRIQHFNGASTNWDVQSRGVDEGRNRRPPPPKLRQSDVKRH